MSDKKGSRDISELKQRLGLKKQGGPAPAATRNNGVVPPPGMNLPPPPGVTPAAPPQPVIPNAADDPFGAMNAMAAVGTVQRAPEIIIVNDGKPVENVGSAGKGARIAKIVAPAVVAIAVGLIIGRISKEANFYNDGLKDAKALLGDAKSPNTVIATKKLVADLERVLDEMNTKTKLQPDAGFEKQLSDLAGKLEINQGVVFRTKQNALDAELAGLILTFYSGVNELKGMVDTHTKLGKGDVQLAAAAKVKGAAAEIKDNEIAMLVGQSRYAVYLSAPSTSGDANAADKNADFGAKIVEIGAVFCGGKESKTGKCENNDISGFGYRGEMGALFLEGQLVDRGTDNLPARKLIPLLGNGVREQLFKGQEESASVTYYVKRLQEISKRAKKLLEDANKLEARLSTEANKGKRFSFFL